MFKCLFLFVFLFVLPLAHAEQIPLAIGETTIQFPVESDYVRLSETEPKLFAVVQAGLPPKNRLVEVLMSRADVTRLQLGGVAADSYYEVQTLREIESRQISVDDWNTLKPQLSAGMSQMDLNKALAADSGRNDRMSAAAGRPIDLSIGEVGKPVVYRETPWSVNFSLLLPMQVHSGAQSKASTLASVGSFAMVRNKVIYIYGYSTDASADNVARLRSRVNDLVDQTIALNPSDAAVRSTGSLDWSHVGRSAFIGGVIGLLLWIFRRRKA